MPLQRSEIIDAIRETLRQPLNIARIDAFDESARLEDDLQLDSVLLLQLLLNLELTLDIEVPDSAIDKETFATAASLADFLMRQSGASIPVIDADTEQETVEEFEDIKVHCVVSCLCEIIKADQRVDHRIMYFGVWDAETVVNENHQLDYHSASIDHGFFIDWYQQLYSVPVTRWYNDTHSRADNMEALLTLLDEKANSQNVMVMLDMFRLPERENKFNHDPFPHYVMLENSDDPAMLMMWDPDFRWEGLQPKSQVLDAVASPAVAGGYYFDSRDIQPTRDSVIRDYFLACINAQSNPLTDCVRDIVKKHTGLKVGAPSPANLGEALAQLPVLAIRKYAYEHGLAFFWRELNFHDDEFESWCDVLEELVSSYKKIQYRAMKLAEIYSRSKALDESLLSEIQRLLMRQDEREFRIKARLWEAFEQWCLKKGFSPCRERAPLLEAAQ